MNLIQIKQSCVNRLPIHKAIRTRQMLSVSFLLILASLIFLSGQDSLASEDLGLGLEVTCNSPVSARKLTCRSVDFRFLNRTNTSRNCEIRITNRRWNRPDIDIRKQLVVPPGRTETSIVIPNLLDAYDVSYWVDGSLREDLNDDIGGYSSYRYTIVNVGDTDGKVVVACPSGSSSDIERVDIVDPKEFATQWHSYLGMNGVVVVRADAVKKFSSASRTALRRWVVYGGGTLWVWGDDVASSLKLLSLLPPKSMVDGFENIMQPPPSSLSVATETAGLSDIIPARYRKGYGNIGVLKKIHTGLFEQRSIMGDQSAFKPLLTGANENQSLFERLHSVPTIGYAGVTLALALMIGPVNFFVLRRKKKAAWFYVTAPVIAFAGMVVLVCVSVLGDGLGVKMNQRAVLMHEPDLNQGMVYDERGFYAGMAPGGGLHYDPDVAVTPFWHRNDDANQVSYSMDLTKDQHLTDGWLASRHYRGLYTMSPKAVRMGIHVGEVKNGRVTIRNDLPFTVQNADIRVMDGQVKRVFGITEPIDPGQSITVNISEQTAHANIGEMSRSDRALHWQVYAKVDGLPYLDTGGVEAQALSKEYYYVALAP